MQIDYSNVYYAVADASKGIPPDIDGCTLFMYGPSTTPVVTVTTGSWQPNPAAVGQTITSTVTASVNPSYPAPSGHTISQHWSWITGGVYQSADGSSGSFKTYTGNYGIAWTQDSPTTTFKGIFNDPGFYIIKVTATVTFHDDTAGSNIGQPYSGIGYIGGSASDIAATTPPSTAPTHSGPGPMAATAPAAGKGVPVITVAKLQYAIGGSTAFQDVPASPASISVDAGTTVVFKAIPSIAGAAFPSGQPVWSGVKGTASGDTNTVVFTTLASGTQSVTATVGNSSVSANVMVQGVSITVGAVANGSGQIPVLRRVNVNGNIYGSGTTVSLVVTPVNGFNRALSLDVDRHDTSPDVFGVTANAADSNTRSLDYSFYEPVHHSVSAPDGASEFALSFSDNQPKTVILTLTLPFSSVMSAGNYQATIFANPNEQNNSRMGSELSLPITVAENTAPSSSPFSGGANNGMYKAGRTYNKTGPNVNKTKTGSYYDSLSGTLTLPATSPDSMSLVLDYATGDAYDVYSGGLARDPTNGNADEIDIGLTVGHTGNFGYSPTGNYSGGQGPPVNNGKDQIQPGTISFTFEAPGYRDSTIGVIKSNQACLIIGGGNISPGLGLSAVATPSQMYQFSGLPDTWISANQLSVKYITSIAQKAVGGAGGTSYNAPPTPFGSPNVKNPFFYTSGSRVPYVTWGNLGVHVQGSASATSAISLPADESSAGSPYVTSSELDTVP